MPTSDQKSCHRAPNATDYLELPRSELKSCRSPLSCRSDTRSYTGLPSGVADLYIGAATVSSWIAMPVCTNQSGHEDYSGAAENLQTELPRTRPSCNITKTGLFILSDLESSRPVCLFFSDLFEHSRSVILLFKTDLF